MQFVQRLRTIWSWLPAFRAVAETEHLPTAAHELGIVPSSLSRAVKLLEDELAVALFDRAGKGLVLNSAGRALLGAVRDAMRLVDDALGVVIADELRGSVAAVASSDLAHAVLVPATALVAARHAQLSITVLVAPEAELGAMLVRGDADVAVAIDPPTQPELVVSELACWTRAVFARSAIAVPRCVVAGTPSECDDGWPTSTERAIAAWAPDERAALELCCLGELATVAYDAVVRASGHVDRLARSETPRIPSRTLHLLHRRPVGAHRRTDAFTDAIREVVAG
jgi:DNA-binding transcriptional LysR family regulator